MAILSTIDTCLKFPFLIIHITMTMSADQLLRYVIKHYFIVTTTLLALGDLKEVFRQLKTTPYTSFCTCL